MKIFIAYLSLTGLFIIGINLSFAQQNQNTQKPNPEIEVLQNRISVLETKLQTVENVEKMELAAKLAEAEQKLIDTEFDKLKLELKESNYNWLIGWFLLFLAIIAAVGTPLWFLLKSGINKIIENLKSDAHQLIVNEVGKRINMFQEVYDKVDKLNDGFEALEKEHAVTVLDNDNPGYPSEIKSHSESIKGISEELLLSIFNDSTRELEIRWAAADVLVTRKSAPLVTSMFNFLNTLVLSKIDPDIFSSRFIDPQPYWNWLSRFCNQDTYDELKDFLERLIEEDSENKIVFMNWTIILLAQISLEMDLGDSVDMMKKGIPDLQEGEIADTEVTTLAKYFIAFKEPEGIKDILSIGLTDRRPNAEQECLELLLDHDPNFVSEWKEKKEDTNTEGENVDESEPTTE